MVNLEEARRFCDSISAKDKVKKKSKNRFKYVGLAIGAALIAFLIGFNLILPLFNHKEDIDIINVDTKILNPEFLGDELNNNEAYNRRPNSFGGNITMNWSYFWGLFKQYSAWQLEAWNPQIETWIDEYNGENLNEWLTITKTRLSDNASEKIALTVVNNGPIDTFFRFKFGIDLRVKDYVNKTSNFEYVLTYPANLTTDYQVFFNWSDLKQDIQDNKITVNHGVKNLGGKDVFYFVIRGLQELPQGQSYTLDPTFGDTYDSSAVYALDDYIIGITKDGGMSPSVDGQATKISAKLYGFSSNQYGKCALYTQNGGSWNFYAETEEIEGTGINGWFDFSFDPYVNVYDDTTYCITVFTDDPNNKIYYTFLASDYNLEVENYNDNNYPTWADPITFDSSFSPRHVSLYCTYNEGIPWENNAPTVECKTPGNESTEISLTPTVEAYINDTDDNSTTVNFYTSTDGNIWTWAQTNSSVTAYTTVSYVYTGADQGETLYYWKVTAEDEEDNTSRFFKFTTGTAVKWQNVFYWSFDYGNTASNKQGYYWSFDYGNTASNKQGYYWSFDYKNTVSNKQGYYWSFDYKNTVSNKQGYYWSFDYGNTSIFKQGFNTWSFDYGNTASNKQGFYWSFDYSYIAQFKNRYYWSFDYSNTSSWQQGYYWNLDYSNTSIFKQGFNTWSFDYSNTSTWQQGFYWNFDYSNTATYNQGFYWNFDYSNTSIFNQGFYWNFDYSYKNSSKQGYYWNFDYSNSTPITYIIINNVYPANNSNNIPLQPNVYANFEQINGEKMNISIYYGPSLDNTNTLLENFSNINNGTQTSLMFTASSRSNDYYWRICANDGETYNNLTLTFKSEFEDAAGFYPVNNNSYALIGLLGLVGLIAVLWQRKRKGGEEEDEGVVYYVDR